MKIFSFPGHYKTFIIPNTRISANIIVNKQQSENAAWKDEKIVDDFNLKPVLEDKGAFCYTGYFDVPQDGVYYVSTEMDELQIDGKVVLSNDGKLIRHSHTRTSLALEKGKHAFRIFHKIKITLCIHQRHSRFSPLFVRRP